jgi:hypothetical protein
VRSASAVLACALVAAAAALAGCGGSSPTVVSTTTVPETQDPLPKLPHQWKAVRARGQGVAFALPPGWVQGGACLGGTKQRGKTAGAIVVCSPNLLTTVSVAADRSRAALALDPQAFASRAAAALDKAEYGETLHTGPPQSFGHIYDAAAIDGRGHLRGRKFPSKVRVIVLRREELANFTVVIATNAKRSSAAQSREADQIVRTIRDQPSGRSG